MKLLRIVQALLGFSSALAISAQAGGLAIDLKVNKQTVAHINLAIEGDFAVAAVAGETERFNLKEMSWLNGITGQWITLAQCKEWAAQSKAESLKGVESAPAQMRPFLLWTLDPSFMVTKSHGTLRLTSGHVDYVIEGEASKADVDGYFRYAVLNAYKKAMTEKKVPPYSELKAIDEMKALRHIPRTILVTIPGMPGSPPFDIEIAEKKSSSQPGSPASASQPIRSATNRTASARAQKETEQVAAIKSMHAALAAGKYSEFYRDWCHPHWQQQISVEMFAESMRLGRAKTITRLYADVIRAIDAQAGPEVLIACAQDQADQYEFILVSQRWSGALWHLELQLHEGKWKLMDTD